MYTVRSYINQICKNEYYLIWLFLKFKAKMKIITYLKNRIVIIYKSIFNHDLNYLENHHGEFIHYINEWANIQLNKEMRDFEVNDNELYIKIKNIDKLWIKINRYDIKIVILNEIESEYDDITSEELILSKDFINHELFYQKINKSKLKSKNKIILDNYRFIKNLLKNIEFDFKLIKIKKTIQIDGRIMNDFSNETYFKGSLFFKALNNEEYESILSNYSLKIDYYFDNNHYYYSRGINYTGNVSSIKEKINKSECKKFFQSICLTRKQSLLLSEYNNEKGLQDILNMTEAFFIRNIHKKSFFYEKLVRELKNENLKTYFILMRMTVYGNILEILDDIKEYITENLLDKFNKLNDGLLFILNNNKLLESHVVINGRYLQVFNKELGISMRDELEEHEFIITELLNTAYRNINQNHYSEFLDIICELMDNEIIKFDKNSIQDTLLKTRKFLLNNKLESKLKVKEVKKKVIKI